ncbi:uncharacterized protein LOC113780155 [Coffea eugenioides]|uniref:uncharacterized protein LOC113758220 n=1 Tax=Coffea eugenioides TaxID=49369 RepID=UPI000F6147CE|nr:uncharacterized protein LOC113758220 [Coffea eugenioides]XP_027181767.1 uncharacterized protein LOC113780153 [Coffea eugenioides]XP_027181768.1 uncharacterized protein LOC113780154 [Coffea eugenioides]XP_027181769.1 uncharacterized protein LOC113780155 [Coffea eugenioides]
MADLLERMVDQQGQGHGNTTGNPGNNPGNHEGEDRALERFQKFAHPKFIGGLNPDLAEERREDDFIRLRQGASSVVEYETQFTKLSRFASELVLTEQKRIRRFIHGLNVEIQEALAATQLDTFSQALEKAQRIETARKQVKAFHDRKRRQPDSSNFATGQSSRSVPPFKRGRGTDGPRPAGTLDQGNFGRGRVGQGPQRGVQRRVLTSGTRPTCGFCGANHTDENCWKNSSIRKCYKCGSTEQLIAQCPKMQKKRPKPPTEGTTTKPSNAGKNRPKGPVRVYAMGQQEVIDPSAGIKGTPFPIGAPQVFIRP